MKAIQTIAEVYEPEDVYNMDESGLFYKLTQSKGRATQLLPGLKKHKDWISVVFCTNATGTDRLPLWFIGKSKNPRCFKNVSIPQMGGQWRANVTAWMTGRIMKEWLEAFYQHIGPNRKVLLAMDNFSGHISGMELAPPPGNIAFCFLPPNSTSRFQPLGHGIIRSFKICYRKHWLRHMLKCYEINVNPLDMVNFFQAIKWGLLSWNFEISSVTIGNCFRKSNLVITPVALPTPLDLTQVSDLYEEVRRIGNIQDAMVTANFMNPEEEVDPVDSSAARTDIDVLIAEQLGSGLEDDPEEPIGPIKREIPLAEVRAALLLDLEYAEGNEAVKTEHLRVLQMLEREFAALHHFS